jgi:hypothetical protein
MEINQVSPIRENLDNQVSPIRGNLDVQCTHQFLHISKPLWTLTGEWGYTWDFNPRPF